MTWTEIEAYRQLEQEYEQELARFKEEESAYREAVTKGLSTPGLRETYEQLSTKRRELESKLDRLKQMRNNLAHRREEVGQEFVL
jgi:uncharacterized protein involved in exopolysaccharide biosynthesis